MELCSATDEDRSVLRPLVDAYWDEIMPTAATVRTREGRDQYFASRFGDPACETMLGVDGDAVVGFARVVIEGTKAQISDFYIDAGHRRRGLGTAMWKALQSLFDGLGVAEITLTVRRDTPAALAFWKAQGFVIGHYELKQFRDPASGTAFVGALSSDFDDGRS